MKPLAQRCQAASHASLPALMEVPLDCARRMGFEQARLARLELALEEVLVNIVSYAYGEETGSIELRCLEDSEGNLHIEIADNGMPFDPLEEAPPPDLEACIEDRRVGGLGLHLVKQFVDGIHYRRQDDRNILTLLMRP